MLAQCAFSDLLLLPDGSAMLKGTPETDQQLTPVPEDCHTEITELRARLSSAFLAEARLGQDGIKDMPATLRVEHCGVQYRVADLYDTKGQTWFLRRLADRVPALNSLGLPEHLLEWLLAAEQKQGLILVTGSQASGKTTTASALLVERLRLYGGHAVTFENPAELPLAGKWGAHGYCFQTEILGEHELASQIERAHRYASPNIIYIGEIRTRFAATEALRVALGSSQQMVIATLHGLDIVAALERLLNWAREQETCAAQNLSNSLLAVLHQDICLENNKRHLRIPQFLLLPFDERSKGIRAKIREGQHQSLPDDMRSQRNRIANGLPILGNL